MAYNSMDDKGMKQISRVRAGRIRDPGPEF
jgi:hypothetical protein